MFGSVFSFTGEMGMVSSGTGELDLSVVGAMTEVDMARVSMWKAEGVSPSRYGGTEICAALRSW